MNTTIIGIRRNIFRVNAFGISVMETSAKRVFQTILSFPKKS